MIVILQGQMVPLENLATAQSYSSRASCYADAAARAQAIRAAGVRGKYLCERDREPDAELARERIVWF